MEYMSLYETELGIGAVFASEEGVSMVQLPHADNELFIARARESARESSPLTEQAAMMLKSYFKGEMQLFDAIPVDLSGLTEFRARILLLIRAIPYGEVRSYSDVAAMAGAPRAARAIGGAMAANPVPIIIPCHRIVASNGRLTGYSAPGGLNIKRMLLRMECAEFKGEVACQVKSSYEQDKFDRY